MFLRHIKKFPYMSLPVVGGLMALGLPAYSTLKTWGKYAKTDSNTIYETTYRRSNGSTYTTTERGSLGPAIVFFFIFAWLMMLGFMVLKVSSLLIASPLIILMSFCLPGTFAALDKECIEVYLSQKKEQKSWPAIVFLALGGGLSFYLTSEFSKIGVVSSKGWGFLFFFLPISAFIFFAFIGPIIVGIISIFHYYHRQEGWNKLINLINIILFFSLFISYNFYMNDYRARDKPVKFDGKVINFNKGSFGESRWELARWMTGNIEGPKNWLAYYAGSVEYVLADGIIWVKELFEVDGEEESKKKLIDKELKVKKMARLKVTSRPTAKVQIVNADERYDVPPGMYEVRIEKEGYFTHYEIYDVKAGLFEKLITLKKMTPAEQENPPYQYAPLYIRVLASYGVDAVVQVMNINEKYRHGMHVNPGKYDIKVSAKGYKTHRQIYEVKDKPLDIIVHLEMDR
ncbi:hypothetical protein [Shewanella sp. SM23]|uniref:hypothetical protein n=1 Tax=Shewanella sp. SM23 TaxID=2912794 RepID=UPI0021DAB66E|nr:hypothetical protein [Shewanella sp. SM23]MCU8085470.1 hypothetical protein [Shewanella sp. SM23]